MGLNMKTEALDIVYTIKNNPKNEELRYSLRSLEKIAHNRVWIYGYCPEWVNEKEVNYIPIEQERNSKWNNTSMLLKEICQNDNITENFIWFNDDFFVLKKIDTLGYYKDRNLFARACDFATLGWWQVNGAYPRRLKQASRELKFKGSKNDNFELHLPIIFNREKLLEVYEEFPNCGAKRSLYCNYYNVDSEQRKDVKIYNMFDKPERNWDFVSTTDESFEDGEVGKYLRKKFNKSCKYERKGK